MPKQAFSKRIRNKGMRAIHECYLETPALTGISPKALYNHGLPKSVDATQLMKVLFGLGYIQYKKDAAGGIHMAQLTEKGICYFEQLHDDRIQLIIHSIILPIIVALATSLLTGLISFSNRTDESANNAPVESSDVSLIMPLPSPVEDYTRTD